MRAAERTLLNTGPETIHSDYYELDAYASETPQNFNYWDNTSSVWKSKSESGIHIPHITILELIDTLTIL
jgi:hypothetical protein